MKTMQEEWREYRDSVYPKGVTEIQNRERHQAFFSGALVAINAMSKLSELPEDNAVRELEKLHVEVNAICQARVDTLKARN